MPAEEIADQANWDELRDSWSAYSEAIEAWIEAATRDADHHEVDRLVHAVISEHNAWSGALSRVVEATHRH